MVTQYYATWALNVSVRMTGMGIPGNLPLIKHNCTSGRTHVSKGGVSHEVSDSYLRHSSDDSREEGVSLDPELVDCLVVYMIFDN